MCPDTIPSERVSPVNLNAWIVTLLGLLVGRTGRARRACRQATDTPCHTCSGLGLTRGTRGRWSRFCGRCGGGAQVDGWSTRMLDARTGGRWLPRSGTVARGR